MRFSIIVPIYNVEKYISTCIESVLKQTFDDYELILVVDGSPDGSLDICKSFSDRDSRIRVIEKENSGVSDTRNMGMKAAKGDFICFIDGDDYLKDGSLGRFSKVIDEHPDLEVLLGRLDVIKDDGTYLKDPVSYRHFDRTAKSLDNLCKLIQYDELVWNVFAHIFRREFIEAHDLYFTQGQVGSEDLDFVFKVLIQECRLAVIDESMCVYRIFRQGSATTKFNFGLYQGELAMAKKWFDYIQGDLKVTQDEERILCTFFAKQFIRKVSVIHRFDKERLNRVLPLIKDSTYIIKYPSGVKNTIIYRLYSVFGYKIGAKILHIYHRIHLKLKVLRS